MEDKANSKEKVAFIIRHLEPMWAYEHSQRAGPAFLNYVNKNGKRSLRLHIQIKERRNWKNTVQQITVLLPIPLADRILRKVLQDGPINRREKITLQKMRFVKRAPAKK